MTKRKPDPLFDVCVELCDGGGKGPITKSEHGKWSKAIKELRDAGATPEQLRAAIAAYKRRNKGCACNPLAIAGQWGRLLAGDTSAALLDGFRLVQDRWLAIPLQQRWKLTLAVGASAPAEVTGDPRLLRQALAIWDKEQK